MMQAKLEVQGALACLILSGAFRFDGRLKFKEATQGIVADMNIRQLDVDLSMVDYIDSSGLGMLLLLRERMKGRPIRLLNPQPVVVATLDIANFAKIFTIIR
jgi:HptB-dependent secretion and biofilm anti anti-sigma factor